MRDGCTSWHALEGIVSIDTADVPLPGRVGIGGVTRDAVAAPNGCLSWTITFKGHGQSITVPMPVVKIDASTIDCTRRQMTSKEIEQPRLYWS